MIVKDKCYEVLLVQIVFEKGYIYGQNNVLPPTCSMRQKDLNKKIPLLKKVIYTHHLLYATLTIGIAFLLL